MGKSAQINEFIIRFNAIPMIHIYYEMIIPFPWRFSHNIEPCQIMGEEVPAINANNNIPIAIYSTGFLASKFAIPLR